MCKVISKYKLYLILNNERNFHEKKNIIKYEKFILFALIPPPLHEQKKN